MKWKESRPWLKCGVIAGGIIIGFYVLMVIFNLLSVISGNIEFLSNAFRLLGRAAYFPIFFFGKPAIFIIKSFGFNYNKIFFQNIGAGIFGSSFYLNPLGIVLLILLCSIAGSVIGLLIEKIKLPKPKPNTLIKVFAIIGIITGFLTAIFLSWTNTNIITEFIVVILYGAIGLLIGWLLR